MWAGDSASIYLQRGWDALVKDNDTTAFLYFSKAHDIAVKNGNISHTAEALLDMGICSYGVSYANGLRYAAAALTEYGRLPVSDPVAKTGRSRCLQLFSTIYSRQSKYTEALQLSYEALSGLAASDTTGTRGLIYNTFGNVYHILQKEDSSEYYYRLALEEHLAHKKYVYLPQAYLQMGEIALHKNDRTLSLRDFQRALAIADSSGNRQAVVSSLLSLGKWYIHFEGNLSAGEDYFKKARNIAGGISDKKFSINALNALISLNETKRDFETAFRLRGEADIIKEDFFNLEREHITRSLEIQFEVSEKERALVMLRQQQQLTRFTNWLLWGGIVIVAIISICIVWVLRRDNNKNKLLLSAQTELQKANEARQQLKEEQWRHDLEYKENQLSALTLQMYQKNELMQELQQELLQNNRQQEINPGLNKIINKGMIQDKEWEDFNTHFESINKNFYEKIKNSFPEISPNDLKICALIKLNLSIKEMAGILNISPDSVKTARYRLRKKLQLKTEENLTEFIRGLS